MNDLIEAYKGPKPNIISQEIDTNTYIIHGKMRNGKTMLATILAQKWKKRIYSNVNIYENGTLMIKPLLDLESIKNIKFSFEPGLVIIDESGLNYSSRKWNSEGNTVLTEILFLIGKKNCSLIWIAQRFESIDVNARSLADAIFKVKKIKKNNYHPIFLIERQRINISNKQKLDSLYSWNFDMLKFQKIFKIEYEQLSESKLKPVQVSGSDKPAGIRKQKLEESEG